MNILDKALFLSCIKIAFSYVFLAFMLVAIGGFGNETFRGFNRLRFFDYIEHIGWCMIKASFIIVPIAGIYLMWFHK